MADQKKQKGKADLDDLVELMARLREKDGCPWDRDQTPESLTPYVIEEAHELVDAIKEGNPAHVCEELGDLLFQIIFQARIASENGKFDMADVIEGIHSKMTRRHPHVFGETRVGSAEEVRQNWVIIKEAEGKKQGESVLGRVPRSLPSLLRGRRFTENAAEVGFDWEKTRDVLEKFDEEWEEFKNSMKSGDQGQVEDEFGDVLFVLVNLSRFLKIDPEQALNKAIAKFVRRFEFMEKNIAEGDKSISELSLEELESYWQKAKKQGL